MKQRKDNRYIGVLLPILYIPAHFDNQNLMKNFKAAFNNTMQDVAC